MRKTFFFLMLALAAIPAISEAAVVYLKDGSRLVGTVVSATARDIEVYTPHGTLHIDTDQIERVEYSETGTAPAAPQPAPKAAPPSPPPGRYPAPRRRWNPEPEYLLEDRPQEFSIGMGIAAPLSQVDLSALGGGKGGNGDVGFLINTQYLYHVSPRVGIGMGLDYFTRSATDSGNLVPNSDTNVGGDSLVLMGLLKYSLTDRGSARPFILGGIGAHRTSTFIDATPNLGFVWNDTNTDETRRLVDGIKWGLATTIRTGIDFELMPAWMFTLQIGWTGLYNGDYPATSAGQALGLSNVSGPLHVLTVDGRWGWRF